MLRCATSAQVRREEYLMGITSLACMKWDRNSELDTPTWRILRARPWDAGTVRCNTTASHTASSQIKFLFVLGSNIQLVPAVMYSLQYAPLDRPETETFTFPGAHSALSPNTNDY
jgi:hypothetical protein